MATSKGKARKSATPRVSVTLPPDVHRMLEQIAREKKVSLAWVVRDAAEKYIANKWPLLRATGRGVIVWTTFRHPSDPRSCRASVRRTPGRKCWCAVSSSREGYRYRLHDRKLPGCPGSRVPRARQGHFRAWVLLAPARGLRARAHAQIPPRFLGAEAHGQQGARRAQQETAREGRLEGADDLGMPAQGH